MAGQGAARRANARRAREKKQLKKKASKQAKQYKNYIALFPKITEEDLLNYQIRHFGDDSRPERWFVPAEEAINFKPPELDDGLGYYPDGVKRTLTDEQIAIFRRTELWQMKREQQRKKEDEREERRMEEGDADRASSPASESSLEDELLAYASKQTRGKSPSPFPAEPKPEQRKEEFKSQSPAPAQPGAQKKKSKQPSVERSGSEAPMVSKNRKRPAEVPYDQRHKRKWEAHIEEIDPSKGSLTHRRLVRELDNQQTESIEMDY